MRDRRNAARWSEFTDSDVPLSHIMMEPDLAFAWAPDRSITTVELSKRCLHRLDGEMAKYGEGCLSARSPPPTQPSPPAHVVDGRSRTAHDAGGS